MTAPAKKSRPAMKWKAAPAELVRTFESAVGNLRGAELRKMFGYPAAFVGGNMLGGLFQDSMVLRLSADDLDGFRKQGAKPFEPMPGRVMREYLVVPPTVLQSKPKLRRWLAKAFSYTSTVPPKARKSKSKKA